jgi:CheY-like chemotaxis protein
MRQQELQGRSVLVVEDDCVIALDFEETLSAAGARVIGPALTIDAAVDLLHRFPLLDVALLDVNIAGTAVFDLADELTRREIPIVFTTGYERTQIPLRFDAAPHCPKPTRVSTITRILGDELERRRSRANSGAH